MAPSSSTSSAQEQAAPALEARGLVKSYGEHRVVDGLDVVCGAGRVLGLLGANGAGKTTTLRMLYGFVEPQAGTIRYEGRDFRTHRNEALRTIGVCSQDDTLDYDFTVEQNLRVYASYYRPRVEDLEERVASLIERFGLTRWADASPQVLSGGYKRRLQIARSIVHRPRILFLDEPTTGLDPGARVEVWRLVDALRKEGMAVVLTTHYMDEAARLSDELLVIDRGRCVAQGTTDEVLGSLLGEHVAVIPAESVAAAERGEPEARATLDELLAWARTELGREPLDLLGELHLPMRSSALPTFTERFGARLPGFQIRPPTLDDVFLELERTTASSTSPAGDPTT